MNSELVKMFKTIADHEDKLGRKFPASSFKKVANQLACLGYEVSSVANVQGLNGFGKSSVEVMEEYFRTGKSTRYELAKAELGGTCRSDSFYPVTEEEKVVAELGTIPGVGPVTAKKLYDYGFRSKKMFKDRMKKIKEGEAIGTSGVSLTKQMMVGLEFEAHTDATRMTIEEHDAIANPIMESIKKCGIENVMVAGSRRRNKSSIGDIDIIIADNANHADILKMCGDLLDTVVVSGDKKVSGIKDRRQVDFRIVDENQLGAMLLHSTGSADFNRMMRVKAMDRGWKLSEYGLRDRDTEAVIASATEEEIFAKLDMVFVKPEDRSV